MKETFKLAWRALVRGGTFFSLTAAVAGIYFLMPPLIRTDGTELGMQEMFVRVVMGGAYCVLMLSVLCSSAGFFSNERVSGRLSLSLVRPSGAFSTALGVWMSYCLMAFCVLVLAGVLTLFLSPFNPEAPCRHRKTPIFEPPEKVAAQIMEAYLADPNTPEEVRKTPKSVLLSYLASKEADRYESVKTNAVRTWEFDEELLKEKDISVRIRFSSAMELASDVEGRFALGDMGASFSNITQSTISVPLEKGIVRNVQSAKDGRCVLVFKNTGRRSVMVRPRKDIEISYPADSFCMNLFRSLTVQFAVISMLAAFGLFLSSGLSRPVAVFTALVSVAVVSMTPGVLDQYPDALKTSFADKFGLWVTRTIQSATKWMDSSSPVESLALNRCVEWSEAIGAFSTCFVVSVMFLFAASCLLRRKQ